ncbi:MAG: hydroxymyristoyl-ACP dehydratase [Bacteroidota bacterium]
MLDQVKNNEIIKKLPYSPPFLFVDRILELDENHIIGEYTYKKKEFFYKGHFSGNPVTPGVILLETMGQIGLVCFGLYLMDIKDKNGWTPLLANLVSDFYQIIKPETKVIVRAEKIYFRRNILKANIIMTTENKSKIASSTAVCNFIYSQK